jgi:hypothetical protein
MSEEVKNDYKICDQAVLGCVAYAMGANENEQKLVMETLEKFGVRPDWFHDLRHKKLYEAVYAYWKREHALDMYLVSKEYDGAEYTSLLAELWTRTSIRIISRITATRSSASTFTALRTGLSWRRSRK